MIGRYYRTTFNYFANWYWLFNASPANARYPVSYLQGIHVLVLVRGAELVVFGNFILPLPSSLLDHPSGFWMIDTIAFGFLFLIMNLRVFNKEYICKIEGKFVKSKLKVLPKLLLFVVPGLCLGMLGIVALFGS